MIPSGIAINLLVVATSAFVGAVCEPALGGEGTYSSRVVKSLLGPLVGSLAPNIASSMLGSKVEHIQGQEELRRRGLRNHDIHRLIGRAIDTVMEDVERGWRSDHTFTGDELRAIRRAFAANWPGAELPLDDSRVEHALGDPASEGHKPSLMTAEQWREVVVSVSGIGERTANKEVLKRLGEALQERFHAAVWELAARSWKERDLAWPKLVLRLLSTISADTGKILAAGEEARKEAKELSAKLDAVIARTARSLGDLLDRPWEWPTDYLFHFSQGGPLVAEGALSETRQYMGEFLADPRPLCWALWTGLEGAGKSRLAMEECRAAISQGWSAGFLAMSSLKQINQTWDAVGVEGDVLVVLDYVGLAPADVRQFLDSLHARLSGGGAPGRRVRVLMLERHVGSLSVGTAFGQQPNWFRELLDKNTEEVRSARLRGMQFPVPGEPSFHIRELDEESARSLTLQFLARQPRPPAPERAASIADRVVELLTPACMRPLHVQVTAMVLHELASEESGRAPANFRDVVGRYLHHRIALRRDQLAGILGGRDEADRALSLVCVATVLGELDWAAMPEHPDLPSRKEMKSAGLVLHALGQSFDAPKLIGLQPDLLGEWFVLLWCKETTLGGGMTTDSLLEVLGLIPGIEANLKHFVGRTYRNFRDEELWRRLRNRLGRYSTPFGEIFDSRANQSLLLGGDAAAAEECYSAAVHARIGEIIGQREEAVVVDLMAGGAARPDELLARFPKGLCLVAIDRDVSRLQRSAYPAHLQVVAREVAGRVDLSGILAAKTSERRCDLVIAKKALHELPWEQQVALIEELGQTVRPGGAAIIYADSPVRMTPTSFSRWLKLDTALKAYLPMEDRHRVHSDEEAIARFTPPSERFDPDFASDAAVFANLWIRLKDWANYNSHEYQHRYFSSRNQLEEAFDDAGFTPRPLENSLSMSLQATRFVEEAINRLGYLCFDSTASAEQLAGVFASNTRYRVFWEIVSRHLWDGDRPTAFGASEHVRAEWPQPFDFDGLLALMDSGTLDPRLKTIRFEPLAGPSFRMPIQVMVFEKR